MLLLWNLLPLSYWKTLVYDNIWQKNSYRHYRCTEMLTFRSSRMKTKQSELPPQRIPNPSDNCICYLYSNLVLWKATWLCWLLLWLDVIPLHCCTGESVSVLQESLWCLWSLSVWCGSKLSVHGLHQLLSRRITPAWIPVIRYCSGQEGMCYLPAC